MYYLSHSWLLIIFHVVMYSVSTEGGSLTEIMQSKTLLGMVPFTDGSPNKTSMKNSGWYTNLRRHFENEAKTKETSCRVMGATLKSATPQSSDSDSRDVKHYFSRLVRSNKSLIDEELPDPDKVQNIRAMFQESLNLTLQKNFNRLGGSLQNIHSRQAADDQFARPKSAQGNSNDFVAEFPKMKNDETVVSGGGRTITGSGTALKENTKGNLVPFFDFRLHSKSFRRQFKSVENETWKLLT